MYNVFKLEHSYKRHKCTNMVWFLYNMCRHILLALLLFSENQVRHSIKFMEFWIKSNCMCFINEVLEVIIFYGLFFAKGKQLHLEQLVWTLIKFKLE